MKTITYATRGCPKCNNSMMSVILSAKGNRYECENCGYTEEISGVDMPPIENFVTGMSIAGSGHDVECWECQHLMFSDCYGECSKGYKGIVNPHDSCGNGEKRVKE